MCTLYVHVAACVTSFLCFILSASPERKLYRCCTPPLSISCAWRCAIPPPEVREGEALGCSMMSQKDREPWFQSGRCPALGQVTSTLSHHFLTVSHSHGFSWALQEPSMTGRAVSGTLVCGASCEEIHCLTLRFGRIVFQMNTGSRLIGWPR